MSEEKNIVMKYFEGWKQGRFEPGLLADDVTFAGPIVKAKNLQELLKIVQEMNERFTVTGINFTGVFSNEGQACVFYDFVTSAPLEMTTKCAEYFNIENGKIKEIHLIYDARAWEKVMAQ